MGNTFITGFQNVCLKNLTASQCHFATLCDFLAATTFILALVPQIHKNSYIKSVQGLSVLWATALFTANLVNCFYSFETRKNIYFKITVIICCVTAFAILTQFWLFSKNNFQFKIALFGSCIMVWSALITIELSVPKPHAFYKLEWVAVVLFSVDLLPQVMLNVMKRSTLSQSNIAVVVATLAKSFHFITANLLVISLEFKVMGYFAVFIGHINCFQLIWYKRPIIYTKNSQNYGLEDSATSETPKCFELKAENEVAPADGIMDGEALHHEYEEFSPIISDREVHFPSYVGRFKRMTVFQVIVMAYVVISMLCLTIGACFVAKSGLMLFAPFLVLMIVFLTTLYRDYQEGRFCFCQNMCDHLHTVVFGGGTM